MGVLSNLEPERVFRFFEEICSIPHGSSDTKKISDYLVQFAIDRGLRYMQDGNNNVIIFKTGSRGYENSQPVIIQGHMDMVCEKEADCDIDFSRDPLRLRLEDGIISADGTTLGGDDGIAVAYALAIMDDDSIVHPPLECVFTVDEEIGMLGAQALDCTPLHSKIMLNIDSEDSESLLVSCAGGVCASCHIPVEYEKAGNMMKVRVKVKGATGGHSGVEIIKQRANADKILGRCLYYIGREVPFRLVSVEGGLKDNAIPKESEAVVAVREADFDMFMVCLEKIENIVTKEYAGTDHDLKLIAGKAGMAAEVMTEQSSENIISALMMIPDGIQKMSNYIEGLVQTSLNLGILKTKGNEVSMCLSVRSSVQTEKEYLVDKLECIMKTFGGKLELTGDYPAWEYKKGSPLRKLMVQVFEDQNGYSPAVQAIHAGVECGLFAGKIKDLDCVSFGPDINYIHTTKESMSVDSVVRTWNFLLEVLRRLK